MAQQLTVKAYLKRWNVERKQLEANDEIRRFSVDLDVSTSYEYLLAKVNSMFPGLTNKSLTLYWKDADNDMIAFSSDDELMEAMRGINDGILRIFITEKEPTSSSSSATNEPLHFGVTCDGCEGVVRGVRHKCTVCPDYDLCGRCRSTGMHREHEMRTITDPLPWGMFCGPFGGGFPQGHPPQPGAFCPPPPPPAYAPNFDGGCCDPEQVRRMTRRAWKRWYKETYGEDHKRQMKKEKKEKKKQRKAEKAKDKDSAAKPDAKKESTSDTSSSSDTDGEQSPGSEYLRNVGESVAAMLDPLGIDVEVDVETRGLRKRCRPGMMRGRGGGPGYWCHQGMRGGQCGPWAGRGTGACGGPWAGRGGPKGRIGCHIRGHFGRGGGPVQPTSAAAAAAATSPVTDPQSTSAVPPRRDPDTNSETGELASGHFATAPAADNDWTLVNNSGGQADVEGATDGVQQLHVSPNDAAAAAAVDADNIMATDTMYPALPVDPVIEESVEMMMSMGYSNDGGWLTQLMIAHQGDIGRALDAIQAKK